MSPDENTAQSADADQARDRQAGTGGSKLLSRDFFLLFVLLLFCNCSIAIYYCFEQWLDKATVSPNWRGLLLGALFGMIMLTRPLASVFLLGRNKLPWVLGSLIVSTAVMLGYHLLPVDAPGFVWQVLAFRMAQGCALGIFSACTVAVMVSLFPRSQSARGFALFSLTFLLPHAMMPALGEALLPLLANFGGEPGLFALTGLLGLPALVLTLKLAPILRRPESAGKAEGPGAILASARHSGLGLIFLSSLCFGLTTTIGLFFMKGLCSVTGGNPALFYLIYTLTMVVIRTTCSKLLDHLPHYRIAPVCAGIMGLTFLAIAWMPLWAYIPATFLYGAALSLLYPLIAAIICNRSAPGTRGLNSNFMMLTIDAAGLLAPILGGEVINLGFGYRGVFVAGALLILVCGLCIALDGFRVRRQGRSKGIAVS